jgi:signal transduction histidine kinase
MFLEQQRIERPLKAAKSWVGVPLIAADKIVGVLSIQSYNQEELFNRHDESILSTIGAQAAIAIENARLYAQLRQELIERKWAAEELRKAKEIAEAANRAKSTFLATMSHELRTPLTAIIGYSELLQRESQIMGYAILAPDLEKIGAAGKHLLALINDILDLSKIEAGKMSLYPEIFSVDSLIRDVVSLIHPLIEKNANILHVHCAATVGTMYADLTKVRQSLFNLLSNAAKFTEQGNITLTVSREMSQDVDRISFQVADTGIGMTADQMQRLFKEFTQVDAATTHKHGGTGLGLALSRRFARMMDGDITVTSEARYGSIFTLRLPALTSVAIGEKAEFNA